MIRTDRKYNRQRADNREARIARMEQEMDALTEQMFDHPEQCTTENIRRLNCLSTQVAVMRGEKVYHVNPE